MKNIVKEELFLLLFSIGLYIMACFTKYYFVLNYVYIICLIVGFIIEVKEYKKEIIGEGLKGKPLHDVFMECISFGLASVSIEVVLSNISNVIIF